MNFDVKTPNPNIGSSDFYVKDGFKHCTKCDTPIETMVRLGAEDKKMPCLCVCKTVERDAQRLAFKSRQEAEYRSARKKQHIQDPDMRRMTFKSDNGACPAQVEKARKYVAQFETNREENIGLLFYGDVGTGKTFVASCIANALDDKGYNVLGTNLSRLRNGIPGEFDRDNNRNAYFDSLTAYDLLFIDDFGIERQTDFTLEQIFLLIDARYKSGRPTIITSNLTPEQLKNPKNLSQRRIFDRITGMCCPMLFEGESQRQIQQKEKMQAARKMLS